MLTGLLSNKAHVTIQHHGKIEHAPFCSVLMRQCAFAQINDTDRDGAWLDFQHGVAGMITPTFDRTGPSDLCSVMNEDSRNSGHT